MDRQPFRSDSPDVEGPSFIQSQQSNEILASKHLIPPPRMLLPRQTDNQPQSLLPMLPLPAFVGIIPNFQPLQQAQFHSVKTDENCFNWIGDAFDNIVFRKYEQASYMKVDDAQENWNIWACDVNKLAQVKGQKSSQNDAKKNTEELLPYYQPKNQMDKTLIFQSRFQSGNLSLVSKVTETEYNLLIQNDINTNGYSQWFFFRVKNMSKSMKVKFNILNLYKHNNLYAQGMKIMIYSVRQSQQKNLSWHRGGENIKYYENGYSKSTTQYKPFYTLSWDYIFPQDSDQVYFAYNYPYTYSNLKSLVSKIQTDSFTQNICRRSVLCKTLAGNNVDLLTVTEDHPFQQLDKGYIIIIARIHPGQTVSSYVCNGIIQFLISNNQNAKKLRHSFIFKIIPMMNPDGVIHGNYRSNISGFDLNRKWQNPSKHYHPQVYHCKKLIENLNQYGQVMMFCDLHGHSMKKNAFIYGTHDSLNQRKGKQFPFIISKLFKGFSFKDCSFLKKQQRQGTTRTVLSRQVFDNNVYTLQSSFCGPEYDNIHFTVRHFEQLGEKFCEAILHHFKQQIKQMRIQAAMKDKTHFELQRHDQSCDSQLEYQTLINFQQIDGMNIKQRVNSENSQGSEPQNEVQTMLDQKTIKKYLIMKNTRPLTSLFGKRSNLKKTLSKDMTAKFRQRKLEFNIKSNSPTKRRDLYETPKIQKLIRPLKIQEKIQRVKLEPKLFEPIQFMSAGLERKRNHRSVTKFSQYQSQRISRNLGEQKGSKSNVKLVFSRNHDIKSQTEPMFKNTCLKGFIKQDEKKRRGSDFIIRKNKLGGLDDRNSTNLFKSVLSSLRKEKK